MSVKIMAAAWEVSLPAMDKLVLLALADWANDQGQCWPSISQLCQKSGASKRHVQAAIKRMADEGHLTRQENAGKGVFYTIHPRTTCTGAPHAPVHQNAQTGAPRAPNTPVTVIKRQKDKPSVSPRASKPSDFVLPEWVPTDAWEGFEAMRKAIKKPLTDRARQLAVKQLEALAAKGHAPGAVLDQSTLNNWQGLFGIKEQHNGRMAGYHGQGAGNRNGQPLRGERTMDFLRAAQRELQDERGHEGGDGGVSHSLALPGFD